MPTGLFSQIALMLLSLSIIFTYVNPTLDEVKKTQDTITVYRTEQEQVSAVNMKLEQISSRLNSISTDDQRRILTYMPDSVDTIAVPRDIKAIADSVGLVVGQIKYIGPAEAETNSAFIDPALIGTAPRLSEKPEAHTFAVDFEASYEQIKQFLSDLEKNAYPLEVHELIIKQTEGGFLSTSMKLVTYDRITPPPPIDPYTIIPNQVTP